MTVALAVVEIFNSAVQGVANGVVIVAGAIFILRTHREHKARMAQLRSIAELQQAQQAQEGGRPLGAMTPRPRYDG